MQSALAFYLIFADVAVVVFGFVAAAADFVVVWGCCCFYCCCCCCGRCFEGKGAWSRGGCLRAGGTASQTILTDLDYLDELLLDRLLFWIQRLFSLLSWTFRLSIFQRLTLASIGLMSVSACQLRICLPHIQRVRPPCAAPTHIQKRGGGLSHRVRKVNAYMLKSALDESPRNPDDIRS